MLFLFSTLLLAIACHAQTTNNTNVTDATFWRITFATSAEPNGCGGFGTGRFLDSGIEISVPSNFTTSCYDLSDLFNSSGLPQRNPSFSITPQSRYNSSASYTKLGFSGGVVLTTPPSPINGDRLTFKTFPGPGCTLQGSGSVWSQWNCREIFGQCTELSYGVVSFSLEQTAEANRSTCSIAGPFGQLNEGSARASVTKMGVLVALLCIVWGLM